MSAACSSRSRVELGLGLGIRHGLGSAPQPLQLDLELLHADRERLALGRRGLELRASLAEPGCGLADDLGELRLAHGELGLELGARAVSGWAGGRASRLQRRLGLCGHRR